MRLTMTGLAALLGALLPAQDLPNAAAVTEPGRTFARPLDMFLAGPGREPQERTLIVLLDPTASLQAAGFADAFDRALKENAGRLGRTLLGLGVIGVKDTVVVPPTDDHGRVAKEIRTRLGRPLGDFQNVYAEVRAVVPAFANTPGARELLLVTLDNGDVEDDIESTVAFLRRAKVRLSAVTVEAYVADSYWAARPYQQKPRDTTLAGGDAPVIDLPWGWMFQMAVANEVTPAAYATYGLSRLAAATEGRVFLYTAPNQTGHQCAFYGSCLFCSGDHLPQDESYWDPRVRQFAPLTLARSEAHQRLGGDPYFRAVVQTWKNAGRAGLLRSEPPVRLSSTSAKPDRQRFGRAIDLMGTLSFARHAKRAERAAADAGKFGTALEQELERIGTGQGILREEANAHLTRVMLQLTRVNLLVFAGWCREVAPGLVAKKREDPLPPEYPIVAPDRRPMGISYSNMCLCHGVRPFFEVELPGAEVVRPELERLDALVVAFLRQYGHSQYAFALHRAGIARFHFTYPGIARRLPRPRPKSKSEDDPVTTPRRPTRRGAGSSGGAAGPKTGGR